MVEMIDAGLSQLRYGVVQMREEGLCQGEPVGDYVGGQELLLMLLMLLISAGMTGGGRCRCVRGRSHGMEETAQVEGPAAECGSRYWWSNRSSTCRRRGRDACADAGRHRILHVLILALAYRPSRRLGSLLVRLHPCHLA